MENVGCIRWRLLECMMTVSEEYDRECRECIRVSEVQIIKPKVSE